VLGLAISIPLVVAGSRLIIKAIERFPVIVIAGGGLLGISRGNRDRGHGGEAWVELNLPQLRYLAPAAASCWSWRRELADAAAHGCRDLALAGDRILPAFSSIGGAHR